MINVKLTLNFRDTSRFRIRLRDDQGNTFWMRRMDTWSDKPEQAYAFDDYRIAEAVLAICQSRMQAWDLRRGVIEQRQLTVVRCRGDGDQKQLIGV